MSAELLEAIRLQQASIERLADHVGLLTQSVAMLLGEEMGQPVKQDEPSEDPHRTMDGVGLKFRNRG